MSVFATSFSSAATCGKMDVVFVADISLSMSDEWRVLQTGMIQMASQLSNSCYDVNVSYYHLSEKDYLGKRGQIAGYAPKDRWIWTKEANSSYCPECYISGRNVPGDNYRPKAASEAWGLGLRSLMNKTDWRTNSTKVIVFFGDNFPTGSNGPNIKFYDALVVQDVNKIAKQKGIVLYGFSKNWEASSKNKYGQNGVSDGYELMKDAVVGTGGNVFAYKNLANASGLIVSNILNTQLTCGYNNIGECKLGKQSCALNSCTLQSCVGAILPQQEICDNKDNDCDGQIDEGDVCNINITCSRNSDCGTDGFVGSAFCVGNLRYQNYRNFVCSLPGTTGSFCSNYTLPQFLNSCAYGCSNGQCLPPIIRCYNDSDCNDNNSSTIDRCINPGQTNSYCNYTTIINPRCNQNSDCGTAGFLGNNFCSNGNVFRNYSIPICNLPGTTGSFCSNSISPVLIQTCAYCCSNGQCLPQINITCSRNSDCGIDGWIGQPQCSNNNLVQDYRTFICNMPGTTGSFCSNLTVSRVLEICNNGCSNGACITIKCYNDSDCDDGKTNTKDSCINPGTNQSYCKYEYTYKGNYNNTFCGKAYGDDLKSNPETVFCGNEICDGEEDEKTCYEDCKKKIIFIENFEGEIISLNPIKTNKGFFKKISDFFFGLF